MQSDELRTAIETRHPARAARPTRGHRRRRRLPGVSGRLVPHREDPRGRRRHRGGQHGPRACPTCDRGPGSGRAADMSRAYRVVAWSTGNVGVHVLAGIDARPDLELVGLWVSNPDKVGRDAGDLAGLGRTPRGHRHRRRRRPLRPPPRRHRPHGHGRPPAEGGARPTSSECSGPGSTCSPAGPSSSSTRWAWSTTPCSTRCGGPPADGGVSLFVNGVDPGFANDVLPLVLTGVSERIERAPLRRDPQLQHLQPAHGALRHHGLRPSRWTRCP